MGIDLGDDRHNGHAAKFSHVFTGLPYISHVFTGLPYILWYGSPIKTWENIVPSHVS